MGMSIELTNLFTNRPDIWRISAWSWAVEVAQVKGANSEEMGSGGCCWGRGSFFEDAEPDDDEEESEDDEDGNDEN